jgi:hypothetical protein
VVEHLMEKLKWVQLASTFYIDWMFSADITQSVHACDLLHFKDIG